MVSLTVDNEDTVFEFLVDQSLTNAIKQATEARKHATLKWKVIWRGKACDSEKKGKSEKLVYRFRNEKNEKSDSIEFTLNQIRANADSVALFDAVFKFEANLGNAEPQVVGPAEKAASEPVIIAERSPKRKSATKEGATQKRPKMRDVVEPLLRSDLALQELDRRNSLLASSQLGANQKLPQELVEIPADRMNLEVQLSPETRAFGKRRRKQSTK
eukprot:TRINITY_DN3360_c0_g1_i3.p1 TRINITY_DN3360_c0_g1~~TRINITY_DN3360_c0_g1_i3.p1  ORF type:complete len:215 (-),score=29.34 TRINITY_DN3360_c0_g1_i3:40-684(-)